MQHKLTKIFRNAKYEPDRNLSKNIWLAVVIRDKRATRLKLWAFAIAGISSFLVLIPASVALLGDFAKSGFYEYFSLIFSDGGSILSYWKELVFSLAESLPAMSIIFTFSLVFICILSLRYFAKQISRNQLLSSVALSI